MQGEHGNAYTQTIKQREEDQRANNIFANELQLYQFIQAKTPATIMRIGVSPTQQQRTKPQQQQPNTHKLQKT